MANNLAPEKFRYSLLASLAECHEPALQLAELDVWAKTVDTWTWMDAPVWRTQDGPATVTVRDVLELYRAWLKATHYGVDDSVTELTARVLARHPAGDPDRVQILSRMQEIVGAGEQFERRSAVRAGLDEAALIGAAAGIADGAESVVQVVSPLCVRLAELQSDRAASLLARFESERTELALDQVASAVVPLLYARCLVGSGHPLEVDGLQEFVEAALKQGHPAADPSCAGRIQSLRQSSGAEMLELVGAEPAPLVYSWLIQLHGLRSARCLAP